MTGLTAVLSSTVLDLQDHRSEVEAACRTLQIDCQMMEYLPATSDRPADISEALITRAELYIGVFGLRYGHIPEGDDISITERELNKAEEAGLRCIIFLSSPDHPWTGNDVERGEGSLKLDKLRARLAERYVCKEFSSPSDLRAKVAEALHTWVKDRDTPEATTQLETQRRLDEDLKQCLGHLHWLTELKAMHDALHRIEIECYKPMRIYLDSPQGEAAFLLPDDAEYELESSINALELVIEKLQASLATNLELVDEQKWVDDLLEAAGVLRPSLENRQHDQVPKAYRKIRHVLHRQPERLNMRLILEAKSFQNSDLVTRLRNESRSAVADDKKTSALLQTLAQLDHLVAEHDAWQNMDSELRLIQYHAVGNLEACWPIVKEQALVIYGPDVTDWPRPLSSVHKAMEENANAGNDNQTHQNFLKFCALAGQQFDKVDQSLKLTCSQTAAAFTSVGYPATVARD